MEKAEKEAMEKKEDDVKNAEAEINYRGVKAMPFIIGKEAQESILLV